MCSKPPAVDLHPALALLIGTWKGEGKGLFNFFFLDIEVY